MSEIVLGEGASKNGHPPVLECFICNAPVTSMEGVFHQPAGGPRLGDAGARNFGVCDAHLERGPNVAWDGDGLPVLLGFRDEQATKEEPMHDHPQAAQPLGPGGDYPPIPKVGDLEPPMSPFMEASQRLDSETERLSLLVEQLHARLHPVLHPLDHPEQVAGGVPRETNPIGLAELVEQQADSVASANRRLQELHDRLGF